MSLKWFPFRVSGQNLACTFSSSCVGKLHAPSHHRTDEFLPYLYLVNTENRKTSCRPLSCYYTPTPIPTPNPPPMQILSLAPGLKDHQFRQQAIKQSCQNNDYATDWPILGSNPSRVKVCFSSRTRHNRL